MNPLPGALGPGDVLGWRLDEWRFKNSWDSGEGSFLYGGRWNGPGIRAVYCSVDPSTSILEVAVHKTFRVLDIVPHVLTCLRIHDPSQIHIVHPTAVPNSNWLQPGIPGAGQQQFGDSLLAANAFVMIPSAVSTHSWNLLFDANRVRGSYSLELQEKFALDTRLHPPAKAI